MLTRRAPSGYAVTSEVTGPKRYLTSSPIITGNFAASGSNHWTVPVGGGIGKLWRIGKVGLPLNTQLVPFYNAVTPDFGPDWQLRFQFLFPR